MFDSKDLNAIGAIADFVRQRKVGNRATAITSSTGISIIPIIASLSCQFCLRFAARKKRDADGFEFTVEQIVEKEAQEALKLGITELHIVGGLHPSLPFSYYLEMLRALKTLDARLQLKCFKSAIEIPASCVAGQKARRADADRIESGGIGFADGRRGGNLPEGSALGHRESGQGNPARNISMYTANGTNWADAARARCYTATSNRWPIAWITCGSYGHCRTRPRVSRR